MNLKTTTTILGTALFLAACSSTGPGGGSSSTDTQHQAATAATADQYGYQFENDSQKQAATHPTDTTAPARNAQGRLAPEAIQRVVRAQFGTFRTCYENALKNNATLSGTVAVSFVIAPDGSVQNAADHGSTLPDTGVVGCVVGGFAKLAFPPPEGGYVTVVYPIEFSPGEQARNLCHSYNCSRHTT
jgi:hypothetical protein